MIAEPVYTKVFGYSTLKAVRKALCPDGKRRYVKITGQPDTMFSVPGQVKVGKKTVTGFVSITGHVLSGNEPDHLFFANVFGKNGHLLPR